MRTFACVCGNPVYFANDICGQCKRRLGFLPDQLTIAAIEPVAGDRWRLAVPPVRRSVPQPERFAVTPAATYRTCHNDQFEQVCNWLINDEDDATYCRACRLNHLIPDLSVAENRTHWRRIEDAKRRLLFTLYRLRLPLDGRAEDPESGLAFDFLADPADGQKVYTGHDNGLITINVAEADDVSRETMRAQMGERYRTLLGHFRHEIGHYFWTRLIEHSAHLNAFRALFGDERVDYETCRLQHYEQGAAGDWPARFVSAYASMHPWEDWAETWAHYLHIVDTLESAADHQLALDGHQISMPPLLLPSPPAAAKQRVLFDQQLLDWGRMALAMNAMNRSMGMPDAYPFVLGPEVLDKLYFVHRMVEAARRA